MKHTNELIKFNYLKIMILVVTMCTGGLTVGYNAGISSSTLIYIMREFPDMTIT